MRSTKRALRDAALLIESLKITRDELVSVSVDSFSTVQIHVNADGFARLFVALRVPDSKLKTSFQQHDHQDPHETTLHAKFTARQAEFAMCATVTRSQWEAKLRSQADDALPEQRPQIGSQQLLLTGPMN